MMFIGFALLVLTTSSYASPLVSDFPQPNHRASIASFSTPHAHSPRITSLIVKRGHFDTASSSPITPFHNHWKGVLYDDTVDATEGDMESEGTMTESDADGHVKTSTSVEQDPSSAIITVTGTPPFSQPTTGGTPRSMEAYPISSDGMPEPSSIPVLRATQPVTPRVHLVVVPIFIGSAIGSLALIGVSILVVCYRRHGRGRGLPSDKNEVSRRWFTSAENEKEGIIISIHVSPPTVPLKGILLQNPTPFSRSLSYPHLDRVSMTSSQMSVIMNRLPKSYNSGLEDGVLDEVREGGHDSPIQASRIGPSPSDFLANLFGHGDNFTPSTSATSGDLTPPSPPQSQPPSQERLPMSLFQMVEPAGPRREDIPALPANASRNPPTPTFPPAVTSPSLGLANGPRGHGLVLLGDQNVPVPSFAHWQYQRPVARSKDGILVGYEQPF